MNKKMLSKIALTTLLLFSANPILSSELPDSKNLDITTQCQEKDHSTVTLYSKEQSTSLLKPLAAFSLAAAILYTQHEPDNFVKESFGRFLLTALATSTSYLYGYFTLAHALFPLKDIKHKKDNQLLLTKPDEVTILLPNNQDSDDALTEAKQQYYECVNNKNKQKHFTYHQIGGALNALLIIPSLMLDPHLICSQVHNALITWGAAEAEMKERKAGGYFIKTDVFKKLSQKIDDARKVIGDTQSELETKKNQYQKILAKAAKKGQAARAFKMLRKEFMNQPKEQSVA